MIDVIGNRVSWYPVGMNILGQAPPVNNVIVPTNEGVTTAIVAFLFVCLIFPSMVKNRQQYYAALGCILVVIFLHAIGAMIKSAAFTVFEGFVTALLQIGSIVLLFLAVGGLSARDLAEDVIEVVRRGNEEKEVIIPLPPHMQAQKEARTAAQEEAPRERINLTPDVPPPDKKESLPLE
jgi:hypothetical protein